jgi:hypothetical protein
MIDRKFFFDHVRRSHFDGHMRQSQVTGMNTILDYWESKLSATISDGLLTLWQQHFMNRFYHAADRRNR